MAVKDDEWAQRRKLAIMCRVAGMQNTIGMFGHISIRIPGTDTVLITPGAGTEKTTVRTDQIFSFDINGKMLHHPGGDRPMQIPAEWRIHTQIHRDRPEIMSVAHLHAWDSTLLGLVNKPIVPTYSQGGFLEGGVPTWDDPRMVLDDDSAVSLSKALGNHVAAQMRGHGSVVVGPTPEQCLANCTFIEENARYQVAAQQFGGPVPFTAEQVAGLNKERHGDFLGRLVWQYWEQRVMETGIPL